MNPLLQKLQKIAHKKERKIVGLMSGTSMDGLDIALCRFRGSGIETSFDLEAFVSKAYPDDLREELLSFATQKYLDPERLCLWHTHLAHIQAGYVREALKEWKQPVSGVDLLASHGQTLYHAPKSKHNNPDMPHTTFQMVDGDHMAAKTGIITICDFRQRDTARGNEGAPLAIYGDYLLFTHREINRILINIGGIANFTWLPAGTTIFPPSGFDTGPGNTLIDAATRKFYPGLRYDKGGEIAASGTVDLQLLKRFKKHPYFSRPHPKTTGFEVFNMSWVEEVLSEYSSEPTPADLLATLTRLTAETLSDEIQKILPDGETAEAFVSGGGAYNDTLMRELRQSLPSVSFYQSDELGVSADAKEALFFAALANEMICGSDTRLHFGKIALPDF